MRKVVIVDFGMGNLHSVFRKMTRIGGAPVVSSEPAEVAEAEMLVIPGVGHFGRAMDNLASRGLIEPLNEAVLTRKVPVLGICLGMQLFATRSEEGNVDGLGWLDARVVRFQVEDPFRFKVPHMGWNAIEQKKPSPLVSNLPPDPSFYFVHSYHFVPGDDGDTLCETEYSYRFVSAVERGNIMGVQFHPEKSHGSGEQLLRNFLSR